MALRETLVAGGLRRDLKEIVAATVSGVNDCPYCVDAHTMMLHASRAHEAARAMRTGAIDALPDAETRSYARWARASRSPGEAILRSPPFSPGESPQVIGTALCFHYINRMVRILLDETPLPSSRTWLRGLLCRLGGLGLSRAARQSHPPGESLVLLPEAPLPEDLAWAAPAPAVAGAFSRLARAVEESARAVLPGSVREVVRASLRDWNGDEPGLSLEWADEAVRSLDRGLRPAGRLALLTALAPHRVDEGVIHAFREHHRGDASLLGALAWGSFEAARRIGTWLWRENDRQGEGT